MNSRLFFVVNPVAGNGKARKIWLEVIQTLKDKNILFDYEETQCKGDGIRIAQEAATRNYKCYVSVGGDGTFHEMINGLMEANLPTLPKTFLLPIGTGNDFVREHNIPNWGEKWLDTLQKMETKTHNVGHISYFKDGQKAHRFFANIVGLFYDAYIIQATSLRKKPVSSSFQYLLVVLKHLFRYQPPKGKITWKKGELSGKYYTANIGICRYSGGGMRLVPHANPFGKTFAVTVARDMHPIRVLFSTHFFYNGKVAKHAKITCFETNQIVIQPINNKDVLVEADGEFLGNAPCKMELIIGGFLLVSPTT